VATAFCILHSAFRRYTPPQSDADPDSARYAAMVERIRERLGLTTLQYQRLPDMIAAIGLPREQLCTFCWNGDDGGCPPPDFKLR